MIIKPILVDDSGEEIKWRKIKKYQKSECPEHGKIYVHKSLRDGKFRCYYCKKEL